LFAAVPAMSSPVYGLRRYRRSLKSAPDPV
jgi:hypothetical protein